MNRIHPSATIGPGVELGEGNTVGANVVLQGPLWIGDDNWIGSGAAIGGPPEIRGVVHGAAWEVVPDSPGIVIGSRNVMREQVLVHQGSVHATTIGDDCFIMNKVYVAHDGRIADRATLSAAVSLAGHVVVGAGANLGMGAVVHQRRIVGGLAMVGMGAVVTRDVPPFALAYGSPCRVHRANVVGMSRAGITSEAIDEVRRAYSTGDAVDVSLLDGTALRIVVDFDEARASSSL